MLKAVIFDLDNTFYSYDECHIEGSKKVYEYLKKICDIDYDKYLEMLESAKKEIKNTLGDTASSHNNVFT